MRIRPGIVSLILAVGLSCAAQSLDGPYDPWSPPARVAERIAKTEVFAFGGIGYAGVTSDGEKDFRRIVALDPAEAIPIFERVYAEGNPQAKAYALAGLRKLAPSRMAELRQGLDGTGGQVHTMRGCIGSDAPLREIAGNIAAGEYDAWLSRYPSGASHSMR
ncbi:MAG TPA: hypothetical protein VFW44_01995 [Bryobacteraceae bacterium]|nr:hypothetical protein [Bryobacteraceae bacterium]